MEHLDGILKLVNAEFDAIEKNGKFRSRDEIDNVYKLVDIVKDIHCIWAYEADDDYSEMGRSYRSGKMSGRSRYSNGRYAPRSYENVGSYDGREEYIENLRSLAENAPDDRTKNNIQRMIREIERT